jgi:hypothetical protein
MRKSFGEQRTGSNEKLRIVVEDDAVMLTGLPAKQTRVSGMHNGKGKTVRSMLCCDVQWFYAMWSCLREVDNGRSYSRGYPAT